MSDIFLTNENGQIVTSSRDVADNFGKAHDKVNRSIKALEKMSPILARCLSIVR